ncbi:alpha/beta-hydrolase [Mollisia scopiformis]|uniref:Alpha/beta-hydrolase n=1 Tax=Mollisia scopiformis TaxID=149040 RepID=A0A194WWH8_MOLSC|nr:alpha/beta-hydrolase [Mollisia scopiformis]KUJ12333.1 alpha/beta-hydrolase [Mollisia scopiformis]
MSTLLPNAPCPFAGYQCEGTPKGTDGLDPDGNPWYLCRPNELYANQCGIIYFPDAKGIWHNSRVLADQFAEAGYFVVVVNSENLVRGEGEPYVAPNRRTNRYPSLAQQKVIFAHAGDWLDQQSCEMIGLVGICAGGRWVIEFLAEDKADAGFVAHPTEIERAQILKIQKPLSVAFADNDSRINKAQRDGIEEGLLASNQAYQISLYSHVHHGFAARRAFTTDAEVFAKRQAFIQAVTWFQEHLVTENEREKIRNPPAV